jgi:predicted TIM-barrel fold metal-dependent hydrolase
VPATTPAQAAALAVDLRRAGLDRLLFGSDYPVFDPGRYAELLRDEVGLTDKELVTIQANSPPGLFDPR